MTAKIVPIGAVASATGNIGNSGNSTDAAADDPQLALLMAPSAETEHHLTDVANKAGMSVLVTMLREHDDNVEAPEAAVRALLLAAAEIRWDITVTGRGAMVSTALLAALDEVREQLLVAAAVAS